MKGHDWFPLNSERENQEKKGVMAVGAWLGAGGYSPGGNPIEGIQGLND